MVGVNNEGLDEVIDLEDSKTVLSTFNPFMVGPLNVSGVTVASCFVPTLSCIGKCLTELAATILIQDILLN